jgi:hypothetical protein
MWPYSIASPNTYRRQINVSDFETRPGESAWDTALNRYGKIVVVAVNLWHFRAVIPERLLLFVLWSVVYNIMSRNPNKIH